MSTFRYSSDFLEKLNPITRRVVFGRCDDNSTRVKRPLPQQSMSKKRTPILS